MCVPPLDAHDVDSCCSGRHNQLQHSDLCTWKAGDDADSIRPIRSICAKMDGVKTDLKSVVKMHAMFFFHEIKNDDVDRRNTKEIPKMNLKMC